MSRRHAAAWALVLLVACGGSGDTRPLPKPTGPPSVRPEVVAEHAEQFDGELPDRPAGSQQEFVAATYLTGHLQQAGYLVRLEAVPVANAVRSSDVIAVPPSGQDARVIVTVAYDTASDGAPQGDALGTFLEVARSLNVLSPEHDVEFAALGADHVSGQLGTRRLLALLKKDGIHPQVISLVGGGANGELRVAGGLAPTLAEFAPSPVQVERGELAANDLFAGAGLSHTTISGDPTVLGQVLLGYLGGTPG